MEEQLYFRQLLAGVDFAVDDPLASQMVNFVYLIGDRKSGLAIAIDPAYDIEGITTHLRNDGMQLAGVLATHYHPDHVGGEMMGYQIEGICSLLEVHDVPIHAQSDELPWIERSTGIDASSLVSHRSGDKLAVGEIEIELIHTPGHTPGSQCFLVDGKLVAGDTLFLNGCGRTDLPGGDPEQLYTSLHERLSHVPDSAILYPGHLYSPEPSADMGKVRKGNYIFRLNTPEQWMQMFGPKLFD
ncbi:MAG TPA: MBL fold metallo-hydrolase [Acidimicrobiales bacterium]|nr:MBL fold metallo-hydrolase [Acidimicrobiales bacterium]